MIEIGNFKLPTYSPPAIPFITFDKLMEEKGGEFLFDIECYPNYFLIGFMSYQTGGMYFMERTETSDFDISKLQWIVNNLVLTGFNSNAYDMPMVWASLYRKNCGELHAISSYLIVDEFSTPYRAAKKFNFRIQHSDSIDLIQVAPSAATMPSLKHYGARMHVAKLQELPVEPTKDLTQQEMQSVKLYNANDLIVTGWLRHTLRDPIELRKDMGRTYGQDLRSLSDAQIAEKVIAKEIEVTTNNAVFVPKFEDSQIFQYRNPEYMRFYTPELQRLHNDILTTKFQTLHSGAVVINENGSLVTAKGKWRVKIDKSVYRLGIGGIHSSESKQTRFSDLDYQLLDRDVASYYPAIILNQKLYPSHIGPAFLEVYQSIVDRRLKAKAAKDKSTANSLKICINGCFGKLGSKWSVFYSPELLIQVTITGQLSLLMLIEMLHYYNIEVISANTDGIVIYCPRTKMKEYESVVADWERITGFVTEETKYASIHSADVNNYFAIGTDGKIKAKGRFTNDLSFQDKNRESLMTNPNATICTEAVMQFLKTCRKPNPTTIESTIEKCKDVRKFLMVRKVKGGAVKDGVYLGKIVRWYISKSQITPIKSYKQNKAGSRAKVSESDCGMPLMDLAGFPSDIDKQWYIRRSHKILKEIGYYQNAEQLTLF